MCKPHCPLCVKRRKRKVFASIKSGLKAAALRHERYLEPEDIGQDEGHGGEASNAYKAQQICKEG